MNIESRVFTTVGHMQTHFGNREKRGDFTQQALFAHSALSLCRNEEGEPTATFVLDRRDHVEMWGFNTIYKAIAGTFHHRILLGGANEAYNPRATYSEMARNAEQFEQLYRQGFRSLNDKLTEEWDGVVIYGVPRTVTGGLIEVITLNPDYVVNDAGQTAAEIHMMRLQHQTKGQIKAKARQLAKTAGHLRALQILTEVAETVETLMPQRGFREDEYGQRLLDF